MVLKNNLQKRLFYSVFIIMTLIILLMTALVAIFESNRFAGIELKSGQDKVINGIFDGTTTSEENQEKLKTHIVFFASVMLGAGFFTLAVTLGLTLFLFKKSFKPLDNFYGQLSLLQRKDGRRTLIEKFAAIDFNGKKSAIQRIKGPDTIIDLEKAFLQARDTLVYEWSQLEKQKHNLEKIVEDKTCELKEVNEELLRHSQERKEIESRLLNVQKLEAIGTLAGGIAHEFNNLFMAITGYASLIQRQSEPDHPNAKKAEKIRNLVDDGSQSIKQLLGFAKSGKYRPAALNINEVLRMNLDMFKKTRKDLLIVTSFTQGIWNIYADRSQMEHIIMNLILNASDAMMQNGKIAIQTNNIVLEKKTVRMNKIVSGKFVHFSIGDEGSGIKPEHIQRIFDPFFTTKPISAGTGLGLASVYGIIDNHDGFVTVESNVGKGTVFNVFLPVFNLEEENK